MIETERKKLYGKDEKYLSIGITKGGIPRTSVWVPWEDTVHAFNMRTPSVYISPEDLNDKEIMGKISTYKVIGCYIWESLQDYSFLTCFKDLQDISINNGETLQNLDFLSELYECSMLYLRSAKLKDLDIIADVKKKSKNVFGALRCIGLDDCEIEDVSVFEKEKMHFSEFLVWKPEGSNESSKWSAVSASKFRYYEFRKRK